MKLERDGLVVLAVASIIFLGTTVSPPSLLDDVDATYSQIARTMLESGDWVTARINGVAYFDKPPGQVWAIAASFAIFGVHDWAARIPMALAAILLCWLTYLVGRWAFGGAAGLCAGLGLSTCVGLFLFTRARIPDIFVAVTTLVALWAFMRALEERGSSKKAHAFAAGAAIGIGVLFKGLIAVVLPVGTLLVYLISTGEWRSSGVWRRLNVPLMACIGVLIAAPWHVLATLRHPPYFELTMVSESGQYHGFFWRYFINEHVLRYLGLRYPKDYNSVPLLAFWLGHLIWLFPWSAYAPTLRNLSFGSENRAGRTRRMMLCCFIFTLLFFSASTSQEYYTLPAYAAVFLLLGSGLESSDRLQRSAGKIAGIASAIACTAAAGTLAYVWNLPAEGDIASSLSQNPEAYTLSLGHMQDLTFESFAYLRGPLLLAAVAFGVGAAGGLFLKGRQTIAALVVMMVIFIHAARLAMVTFDPYLSSRPIAAAYLEVPPGELILDHEYYAFSSLVFYANQRVWLLNGRKNNIEYGSNAPGAPDVFLDDATLADRWRSGSRQYLATFKEDVPRFRDLLGAQQLGIVVESGGKVLLSNTAQPER
jgi:4-amino-4-deoxy-L-arabinose transferase-like glycosyltransferase